MCAVRDCAGTQNHAGVILLRCQGLEQTCRCTSVLSTGSALSGGSRNTTPVKEIREACCPRARTCSTTRHQPAWQRGIVCPQSWRTFSISEATSRAWIRDVLPPARCRGAPLVIGPNDAPRLSSLSASSPRPPSRPATASRLARKSRSRITSICTSTRTFPSALWSPPSPWSARGS